METFKFTVEKTKKANRETGENKNKVFFLTLVLAAHLYEFLVCICICIYYYIHVSLAGFSCLENFMMILPQIHQTCSAFLRFQLLFDVRNNCCLKICYLLLLLLVFICFRLHFFGVCVCVWAVRWGCVCVNFFVVQGHETRPKHIR